MQYVDTNISLETNVDWLDNGELVNEIVLNRPMQQIASIYNGNFEFIEQEFENKLNVGAGGINNKSVLTNDVDNVSLGGFYFGYGGLHMSPSAGDNPFPYFTGAFSLFQAGNNFDTNSPSNNAQIVISQGTNNLKFRSIGGGTNPSYTDWATVLTDEDIKLGVNVPVFNSPGNAFYDGRYLGLGSYWDTVWKAKDNSRGAAIFRNGGADGFQLLVSSDVTTKDQNITGINTFAFKDGEITNDLNDRTFWHDVSLPIQVDNDHFLFDRPIHIDTNRTIAGTNFDNGHLKIGSSSTGVAIDSNEIVMFGSAAATSTFSSTAGTLNITSANVLNLNLQELNIRVDNNLFAEFNNSNIQFKRNILSSNNIEAGVGSGSVGLTVDDGYGNANLTFNHAFGVPDVDGNAGRIHVNVDSDNEAQMKFLIGSGVTSGTAADLTELLKLDDSGAYFKGYKIFHTNDKPTPAEIGAAVDNHIHDEYILKNGDASLNKLYISDWLASKIDNSTYITFENAGKIKFVATGVEKLSINDDQITSNVDISTSGKLKTQSAISVEGNTNRCEMVFDNNSNSLNFNFH